ncbi:MAG: hypothetical protein IKZ52_06245 [Bacteroidales bacterium]|nr:hypothetical protein [Bacteroidales bacterium]
MKRVEYTKEIINSVWEKAKIVPNNADQFRQDYAGAWIKKNEYNENTEFGWKIVVLKPRDNGGKEEDIENLLPFHWRNASEKGNKFPEWDSVLASEGVKNISEKKSWIYIE